MKSKLLLSLTILLSPIITYSDSLTFFDGSGNKTLVQTESLNGCVVVYDSGNRPLEICRLVPATSSTSSNTSSNQSSTVVIDNDKAEIRQTARRTYRRMERRNE